MDWSIVFVMQLKSWHRNLVSQTLNVVSYWQVVCNLF